MEVLEARIMALELMAAVKLVAAPELVAAMKRVTAVKTAMRAAAVPTTPGQRGYRHRCHCQDHNC
jgi:hypothetical protein